MASERRHPLDVERLVTTFARHDVRYLVVGGIAAILHGWPGATADLDVLGAFDSTNLERLSAALRELGAAGAGWDGTPATMASHTAWSLETQAGPVDVLFVLEPHGPTRNSGPPPKPYPPSISPSRSCPWTTSSS